MLNRNMTRNLKEELPGRLESGDVGTNSALKKALGVLEALVELPQPLSVPDICERVGLSRQSGHRIVRHLEALGLVRRDLDRERYMSGPRLAQLGASALGQSYQWGGVHAVLEALVSELGETCNIGMLDGYRVVYVDRVECNWPLRLRLEVGSRVPIHCTAIGKLLLAHLPRHVRDRLVQSLPKERFTQSTLTTSRELIAECERILRRGYSTNDQEYMSGLIAVGIPVRNAAGRIIAGVALHAPVARLSLRQAVRFVPKIEAAAARLGELR